MDGQLPGTHIYLRALERDDAAALLRLNLDNRAFFAGRESRRPEAYYTLDGQLEYIEATETMRAEQRGVSFGVFLRETDELKIGRAHV